MPRNPLQKHQGKENTYGIAEPIAEAEFEGRTRGHRTYIKAWKAIVNDDGALR
jgi:hypothetical protein